MTTLTETAHAGAFIVSEANGFRSRSTGSIPANQTIRVGMVLGKLTVGGGLVPLAPAANDGSQVAAAIAIYPIVTGASAKPLAVMDADAEVRLADLEFPAGISAPNRATAVAQLLALGIKTR